MDDKKIIRIGSWDSTMASGLAHNVQSQLESHGFQSTISLIKESSNKIQGLAEILRSNDIDVVIHTLNDLPTKLPEGVIIAGVSQREDPGQVIVAHTDVIDNSAELKLKSGTIVGASSLLSKVQLKELNDSLQLRDVLGDALSAVHEMKEGRLDAIVLASADVKRLELRREDFHVIQMHPREFIPAPAQGVFGYLCRVDDFSARRILKQIHNTDVSQRTNVERKVLKMMDHEYDLPLGVYCERDNDNNFHVYAVMSRDLKSPLIYAQASQSTSLGLAELIYNKLKNGN